MKLSVVIPIFDEAATLPELYRRLCAAFAALPDFAHEVVYVDDGSSDSSLAVMLEQQRSDARVRVLELSRNFGHQSAVTAGLAAVGGADAVVILDGDLQDPPELIPDMVKCWQQGAEVVRAQRRTRQEQGFRRAWFGLFYRLFGWISDFPIPAQVGVFSLLDRKVVHELNRLPEKNRFLPGLRAWVGFDQQAVVYDRRPRALGDSRQSFSRLCRYALDGVFSFSYKPLRLLLSAGVVVSALGFALASWFVLKRLAGAEVAPTGFTTLITVVLFIGGVQLIAIGLVGEYLGRIYDEVKQRPLYIVRRQYPPSPSNE